ncbi:hypothetical protein BGZ94_003407 [Podila epigama]|nr:hypothetical protein BGZ94_003407 [Podila epigama]
MDFNATLPDADVEQMSNAELFQYLFKAELDSDMAPTTAILTDAFEHNNKDGHNNNNNNNDNDNIFEAVDQPSPASSSSSLSSPLSSSSSSPPSSSSPSTLSLSPASSFSSYSTTHSPAQPPLQQMMDQADQADQTQPLLDLFANHPVATYPTLLPSTSFSYRQLSADMPPSMPTSLTLARPQSQTHLFPTPATQAQTLAQAHTQSQVQAQSQAQAQAQAQPQDQMGVWFQRFQQLQQLHHAQQHQLLTSTLFSSSDATASDNNNVTDTKNRSSSPESSSSTSSSKRSGNHIIYPSPPMRDDMSMDSDSDSGPSHSHDSKADPDGSDPLKPSPSELKKMTSKERRQLRNKLSARNFRVRRKEYIVTLENQVKEARREAAELQKRLAQSELNCQFLRQELETSRLSQTLFSDGRMSKEHANLLASLLNPNTESFPPSSTFGTLGSNRQQQKQQQTHEQQQKELMDSINSNNMTILNNSLGGVAQNLTTAGVASTTSSSLNMDMTGQGAMQPFVPFDGNWELIVNRAELPDPYVDPKEANAKEDVYHKLLARYEAARRDAELDEQMRTELKAYNEQKLAQTYIVMPKEDNIFSAALDKNGQNSLLLQTMVYMMMVHLTRSLFEAATLSKDQLVNVYKTMDAPLRSKMMDRGQEERPMCKFEEWREAWIKKCWPSFYNNRRRVCELLKNGPCYLLLQHREEVDVEQTVRKMEEGVKGKTVEYSPFCLWVMSCIPDWMKCPTMLERERLEKLARDMARSTEMSEEIAV